MFTPEVGGFVLDIWALQDHTLCMRALCIVIWIDSIIKVLLQIGLPW